MKTRISRRPPPLAAMLKPRVRQLDIAKRADVSPSYVHRILDGEVAASIRVRRAAVELLGLPEEVLFGDKLAAEPQPASMPSPAAQVEQEAPQ